MMQATPVLQAHLASGAVIDNHQMHRADDEWFVVTSSVHLAAMARFQPTNYGQEYGQEARAPRLCSNINVATRTASPQRGVSDIRMCGRQTLGFHPTSVPLTEGRNYEKPVNAGFIARCGRPHCALGSSWEALSADFRPIRTPRRDADADARPRSCRRQSPPQAMEATAQTTGWSDQPASRTTAFPDVARAAPGVPARHQASGRFPRCRRRSHTEPTSTRGARW
jgi:hypothetical protein